MWLSKLGKGVTAAIKDIAFSTEATQRMHHLGLSIGQEVCVVRPCHGNSPMMVRTNGAYLMLRRCDADKITVKAA